jgi:hypothetical protein
VAQYVFEVENLGQYLRVFESLKKLDSGILVKEKNEINSFESDMRVKIQLEASYEEVLKQLAETKNSEMPLETIRPLQ